MYSTSSHSTQIISQTQDSTTGSVLGKRASDDRLPADTERAAKFAKSTWSPAGSSVLRNIQMQATQRILQDAADTNDFIYKVCLRFEKLQIYLTSQAKVLPQELISIYCQTKSTNNYRLATKLKEALDTRDNLIFWSYLGVSTIHLEKIKKYQEILDAYKKLHENKIPAFFQVQADSIPQVFKKTEFNLSKSGLTSIPSDLLNYTFTIKTLNLSNNFITEIPQKLRFRLAIDSLNLKNNQITVLPESFGQLRNLTGLDLSNNNLLDLPESFGKLCNLRWLDLSNNQLLSLPNSLSEIYRKFEIFNLSGNLDLSVPEEIALCCKNYGKQLALA